MLKNLLKEIVPLIENVAPVLANSLGAFTKGVPWGLYLLSKAFDVNINDIEKLPQMIKDDPDSDSKVSTIEKNFAEWFMEHAPGLIDGQVIKSVTAEVTFGPK